MIKFDAPAGTPVSVVPPPALAESAGGVPATQEAGEPRGFDDVIDLRSDVPTPYGGRLADLEAMLRHW